MIALIIGIVILLLVLLGAGMMQAGQGTVVPAAECGERTMAYVNNNLVEPGTSATLVSTSESKGMYEVKFTYQSQEGSLRTTKDCTLLFMNFIDMTSVPVTATAQPTQAPVKSDRPSVDLYVMSFCPYGTQAEDVMSPVVQLLGSKADIRVRYITDPIGTATGTVGSLHGPAEGEEDLRQACINRHYPEKTWAYLDAFNDACYPVWTDAAALKTCRENVTMSLGMDNSVIDACARGSEGLDLLRIDETACNQFGIYSSPSLFINNVKYTGARNPEAYKQAICNSFGTAPPECSTILSSTSSTASGGCG
jgi:hypothetical protein